MTTVTVSPLCNNKDHEPSMMSTNNDNLGHRFQAYDPSCILTFMPFTLLRNFIITQVDRHISVRSLAGLRLGSGG